MRNVLDKSCRENENTHFIFNNRTVYQIMSKNVVETKGPQMTSQHGADALRAGLAMLLARMRKHAYTDQYVIVIAFPHQQWLRERASMLRYTYIACLVTVDRRQI
jgi:hypothetical protein